METRSEMIKFWRQLVIVSFIIVGLQFLSSYLIQDSLPAMRHVFGHVYIFTMTGLGFMVFLRVRKKHESMSAIAFGGISMLKMLLAATYLLPVLLKDGEKDVFYVLQFLAIYMIYLLMEVKSLMKIIKADSIQE